jgi:hypothetical protein
MLRNLPHCPEGNLNEKMLAESSDLAHLVVDDEVNL